VSLAAQLEHRSPCALRHTYATFAIAAGVSLFELARFMGTSAEQIDKTYGHLLTDATGRGRRSTFHGRMGRPMQRAFDTLGPLFGPSG
jgi:integrase